MLTDHQIGKVRMVRTNSYDYAKILVILIVTNTIFEEQ